ncbi:MAG: Na(+)-translocating NADH-quinone reductase subunit A [bacterium]
MKIKRGLDIPLAGAPEQRISEAPKATSVAMLGRDFKGLKPSMKVRAGDHVRIGDVLFEDKKNPGVKFTSPGAGTVRAINRGERRVLQSVVIDLDDEEEAIEYEATAPEDLSSLEREAVVARLVETGAWTAFRTRPYSKIPPIDSIPHSIFVTAMDTRPLAADPSVVINEKPDAFVNGLKVISHLTNGKVFVSHAEGADIPRPELPNVSYPAFGGPHPAGLVGTHIHMLDPVSDQKTVWYLSYQDLMAIGHLFVTGKRALERVISLGGPMVKNPRLMRTRQGVCTDCLVNGELKPGAVRVISGSVLAGFRSAGWSAYLGRFNMQVTVLAEGEPRQFLHWLNPWLRDKFSVLNVFAHRQPSYPMTTSQNGSHRAMVPLGNYEAVMPLDILPTQLLRALLIRDTDTAQQLGALELDEEDLSLCTFVCHSKYEYGPALRACLEQIEREG